MLEIKKSMNKWWDSIKFRNIWDEVILYSYICQRICRSTLVELKFNRRSAKIAGDDPFSNSCLSTLIELKIS